MTKKIDIPKDKQKISVINETYIYNLYLFSII
jgi:hypothetical protein